MDKKKLLEKFEKNVLYLRRNIPPDDIYMFAEQTYMAAMFFLYKWSDHVDIQKEMDRDEPTNVWVSNLLTLQELRDKNADISLEVKYNEDDEEYV